MNLKSIHKLKAVDSYKVGKRALDEGKMYPAYLMLKEAARATLTYINEDKENRAYSTKTSFETLLKETPKELLENESLEVFDIFKKYDEDGIESIMVMDKEDLHDVETLTKKLITIYLREDL